MNTEDKRKENKEAWLQYIERVTEPAPARKPTEKEKEMLRRAGYDVR